MTVGRTCSLPTATLLTTWTSEATLATLTSVVTTVVTTLSTETTFWATETALLTSEATLLTAETALLTTEATLLTTVATALTTVATALATVTTLLTTKATALASVATALAVASTLAAVAAAVVMCEVVQNTTLVFVTVFELVGSEGSGNGTGNTSQGRVTTGDLGTTVGTSSTTDNGGEQTSLTFLAGNALLALAVVLLGFVFPLFT